MFCFMGVPQHIAGYQLSWPSSPLIASSIPPITVITQIVSRCTVLLHWRIISLTGVRNVGSTETDMTSGGEVHEHGWKKK